tara:strand:+ start:267 stop:1385 length:1119 start_codon:yes stop_codon:yes gene_type:complete
MKFIVFAEDWGSHPSSTQHLFKELAKNNHILWINSIGMRKPTFRLNDLKRVFNKVMQIFNRSNSEAKNKLPNNMQVFKLPILPWHDNALVRAFNKRVFAKYLKDTNIQEPITYWLSVPVAEYLITLKSADKLIYYCGDDFSALAGVDAKMVAPFEQSLIKKAHLIYVISQLLKNKMPAHKTKMLTHGVNFDLFSSNVAKAPEISTIYEPIIGFYGSINAWLDIALLTALAASRPQYKIVLIGDLTIPIPQLLQFKNVIHIPAVNHNRLVEFSSHWDVSILPFVNNQQIRACDPLKLKEYLAVGKPIVATRFPAVERFQPQIFIAKTQDEFIAHIDKAINLDEPTLSALKTSQSDLAKQHSWSSKALSVEKTF